MDGILRSFSNKNKHQDTFKNLSVAFDNDCQLTNIIKKLGNDFQNMDFDEEFTLQTMIKRGAPLSKKEARELELQKLLNDTSKASAQASALTLKKFKEEMFERKQQLAFRLEKIYFVKRHSGDVFKSLL